MARWFRAQASAQQHKASGRTSLALHAMRRAKLMSDEMTEAAATSQGVAGLMHRQASLAESLGRGGKTTVDVKTAFSGM
eukprot:3337409-Pleurochrysis_carterae.AAC.1